MSQSIWISILKVVHLVSISLWAGGTFFFSFLTTPKIFGFLAEQLPANPPHGIQGITRDVGRMLAGDVVGLIFPSYFAYQLCLGMLAVLTGLLLLRKSLRIDKVRCGLVSLAFAVLTVHATTVYPHSVRLLDAHYDAQAAGEPDKAQSFRQSFRIWHGFSRVLDLVTILLVLVALSVAGLTLRDPS